MGSVPSINIDAFPRRSTSSLDVIQVVCAVERFEQKTVIGRLGKMDVAGSYKNFWVRGLWVFLMLIVINIVLGGVCAGIAFLRRPIVAH